MVKDESINLGDIDTSAITDMSELFEDSTRKDFSGIENWDTSNIENIGAMFLDAAKFNQDLGRWNVGNVKNMGGVFQITHHCLWDSRKQQRIDIDKYVEHDAIAVFDSSPLESNPPAWYKEYLKKCKQSGKARK